jgi:hypothetical protein
MNSKIKMIVHYEINEKMHRQYQEAINYILSQLSTFEAKQIQISKSKNKVIETFLLPTESHYYAIKKLRKSKSHSIFGSLDPVIKGGLEQMSFYGLKQ